MTEGMKRREEKRLRKQKLDEYQEECKILVKKAVNAGTKEESDTYYQ